MIIFRDKKFGSNAGLDLINPGLDLDLGPENQVKVQAGLQNLAKLSFLIIFKYVFLIATNFVDIFLKFELYSVCHTTQNIF